MTSLLKGPPIVARLQVIDGSRYLEVAPAPPRTIYPWLGIVGFVLLVTLLPRVGPPWTGEGMAWLRWSTLIAAPWIVSCLVVLWLARQLLRQRPVAPALAMIDKQSRQLHLPYCCRMVREVEVFQFVELTRWCRVEGAWQPIVQTSVVVREPDGALTMMPIATLSPPSRWPLPLVDQLADLFQEPVLRITQSRSKSEALGDC